MAITGVFRRVAPLFENRFLVRMSCQNMILRWRGVSSGLHCLQCAPFLAPPALCLPSCGKIPRLGMMSVVSLLSPRGTCSGNVVSFKSLLIKKLRSYSLCRICRRFIMGRVPGGDGTPGDDRIRCQALQGLTAVNVPTGHGGGVPGVAPS